ncbi:MAG: DUF3263 domain-containing protein [Brachybacterium tyrofermentans]|uniref:DUF3263 domain-containing protein n=1 Tax=Brachybacterium tyrofermentans TaxID=47848 RepID=A0ABW0FHA3_9MICO|nr:DUF3263 domain-containing protein [Brachybacterium tyrofermentans]SLN02213.1 hypothetical protein FM103_11670 [Corynebacterium xerosis]
MPVDPAQDPDRAQRGTGREPGREPDHDMGAARGGGVGDVGLLGDPAEGSEPGAGRGDAPDDVSDQSLPGPQGGLVERDRMILALESRTFRYVGAKERAIREEIGISKVAYYVRLNSLLDDPAALRAAPAVVNRLRGRRTSEDGAAPSRGTGRVA